MPRLQEGCMAGCLEAVAGPGGYVERATRQGSSSSLSLGQPPALTPRHPAALALSHPGTSTSNPGGNTLLPEQADKPMRKGTAARTPLPPTEALQRALPGPAVEGGAGTYTRTPAGVAAASGSHRPAPAPSPLGPSALDSHSVPSPSHVTSKPQCLFIRRPGYVTSRQGPVQYSQ